MFTVDPNPETWSPDLRMIVSAIARALKGREPTAVLIIALRPDYEHCVPGHNVEVLWIPKGEGVQPHDSNFPAEYALSIDGKRVRAIWTMLARDLHAAVTRENSN
jgi:hypothetical protein